MHIHENEKILPHRYQLHIHIVHILLLKDIHRDGREHICCTSPREKEDARIYMAGSEGADEEREHEFIYSLTFPAMSFTRQHRDEYILPPSPSFLLSKIHRMKEKSAIYIEIHVKWYSQIMLLYILYIFPPLHIENIYNIYIVRKRVLPLHMMRVTVLGGWLFSSIYIDTRWHI